MKIHHARLSILALAALLISLAIAFTASVVLKPATAETQAAPTILTVSAGPGGRRIPDGFLGLSIELPGFAQYAGDNPAAPNALLIQLIKNLTPNQRPVLRLGGDSTDWSWTPLPGMKRPPGIRYTLTNDWIATTRAVAKALNGRLILGVNLEADNAKLAAGEAQVYITGFGLDHIYALELGNEPELYDGFPWYELNGHKVLGRPKTWNYSAFESDFGQIARALPRSAPLAAPSIGSPEWSANLGAFLKSEPRTAIATLHRYPLKRCRASNHLTVGQLLSTSSTTGLANAVIPYVRTAQSHHIPLRIDEMNSISCGGQPGLSDSYASALWAADALYEMARVGVDGVNIHTGPNLTNALFYVNHFGRGWRGAVRPVYYGLLMFAQAAPAGSQIQQVAGKIPAALRVWATRATDGTVRVVLINNGQSVQTVKLKTMGTQANEQAVLEQLRAPSATALSGITLGGQSFGALTTTGLLDGPQNTPALTPQGGFYTVTLPPWSAALVTVAHP